jgi:hypothetical protein
VKISLNDRWKAYFERIKKHRLGPDRRGIRRKTFLKNCYFKTLSYTLIEKIILDRMKRIPTISTEHTNDLLGEKLNLQPFKDAQHVHWIWCPLSEFFPFMNITMAHSGRCMYD